MSKLGSSETFSSPSLEHLPPETQAEVHREGNAGEAVPAALQRKQKALKFDYILNDMGKLKRKSLKGASRVGEGRSFTVSFPVNPQEHGIKPQQP